MNPYIAGGLAFIIITMGVLLKNSYERNGELETKLEHQVGETQQAVDANGTNMTTITELEETITTMVEERRLDIVLRDQVMDERDQELVAARVEAQRLRNEREEAFNENPDCEDLASLSIEFFCPTLGSQLRERSTAGSSN